jgi:hypothetical protein
MSAFEIWAYTIFIIFLVEYTFYFIAAFIQFVDETIESNEKEKRRKEEERLEQESLKKRDELFEKYKLW